MRRYLAAVALVGLLCAACVPDPGPRTVPAPSPPIVITPEAPSGPANTPIPPISQPSSPPAKSTPALPADVIAQRAQAQLAQRLGVDQQAVTVSRVESIDWPSTALGCPQPGMVYAQVITPGYRVVLAHGGTEYVYHTDRTGDRVILCDRPS